MTPHGKRKKLPRSQRVRAYMTKEEVLERYREFVNPDAQAHDGRILYQDPRFKNSPVASLIYVSYSQARKQIHERREAMAKSSDALAAAWMDMNP